MNKKEEFIIQDCVKFKHDLAKKSWEKSGAKTLKEYAEYVNRKAREKEQKNRRIENE